MPPKATTTGKRTGRPRGAPPNRQAILDAARLEFSERGYSGATIRRIAAAAGVDGALVHHYFRSKDELLVAAMQPEDTRVLADLIRGGRSGIGERFLRATFQVYGNADATGWRVLVGLLRSATTHEDAARVLRESLSGGGITQLLEALHVPQARLRAALVTSQLVGLVMARSVLRLEPVASADLESVIAWYAPVLQRCLVCPLPGDADG